MFPEAVADGEAEEEEESEVVLVDDDGDTVVDIAEGHGDGGRGRVAKVESAGRRLKLCKSVPEARLEQVWRGACFWLAS